MVNLLLKVRGVNKNAVNRDGLTPLDIARENTKYHESYKIIEKLSAYPPRLRPFLYSAPTTSLKKQEEAAKIVDDVFTERREAELVVAALLATMTFTAVFTVPGGFYDNKEDSGVLGMPRLIGYNSFKLFLIFDCLAFFLSLFVVLMWEMSTPLTTRDKMLFMYVNNAVVCTAFAFTAYGLIAAVYAMLGHMDVKKMAWIVVGSSVLVVVCANAVFFYMAAKFMVTRARFHHLFGVPLYLDDIVEKIWVTAERYWILDFARNCDEFCRKIVSGIEASEKKRRGTKKVGNECSPPSLETV